MAVHVIPRVGNLIEKKKLLRVERGLWCGESGSQTMLKMEYTGKFIAFSVVIPFSSQINLRLGGTDRFIFRVEK